MVNSIKGFIKCINNNSLEFKLTTGEFKYTETEQMNLLILPFEKFPPNIFYFLFYY